ncbi:MAG: hypothetical protein WBF73_33245 [Bradyrhizobium sp.]
MDSSFGMLDAFAFVVFAWSDHRRQFGQAARPTRAEMESSAGERYKRDELDRDRDRRIALAGRVHLGVHDALWLQILG